jgi:hypothetical protein
VNFQDTKVGCAHNPIGSDAHVARTSRGLRPRAALNRAAIVTHGVKQLVFYLRYEAVSY